MSPARNRALLAFLRVTITRAKKPVYIKRSQFLSQNQFVVDSILERICRLGIVKKNAWSPFILKPSFTCICLQIMLLVFISIFLSCTVNATFVVGFSLAIASVSFIDRRCKTTVLSICSEVLLKKKTTTTKHTKRLPACTEFVMINVASL